MSFPTQASQLRKVKKPLIERRRRERINEYLNELMRLVHEATGTDCNSKSTSKMEKAEILEMTVDYLRKVHHHHRKSGLVAGVHLRCRSSSDSVSLDYQQPPSPLSPPPSSSDKNSTKTNHVTTQEYVAGFNECARQVRRFLHRQYTGNSIENPAAATSTDGEYSVHNTSAGTRDMSQFLWRHLSDYVTSCRTSRHATGTSDKQQQQQLSQQQLRNIEAEVMTSPFGTHTLKMQSPAVSSFPQTGFIFPGEAGLVRPPPGWVAPPQQQQLYAVFSTTPRIVVSPVPLPAAAAPRTKCVDFQSTWHEPETEAEPMSPGGKAWCGGHRISTQDIFVYGTEEAKAADADSVTSGVVLINKQMDTESDEEVARVWRPWGAVSSTTIDENGNYL